MKKYSPKEARQTADKLRERKKEREEELGPQYAVEGMSENFLREVVVRQNGYSEQFLDLVDEYDMAVNTEPLEEAKREAELEESADIYGEIIEQVEERGKTTEDLDGEGTIISLSAASCPCDPVAGVEDGDRLNVKKEANRIVAYTCTSAQNEEDGNVYLTQNQEEQEEHMENIKEQNLREDPEYDALAGAIEEIDRAVEEARESEERVEDALEGVESLLD